MQVTPITMEREEALKMYRKYQTHRHWSRPVDAEIARVFAAISKGKVVIRAIESIKAAGMGSDGLPKLAIARADAKFIWLSSQGTGVRMADTRRWGRIAATHYVDIPMPIKLLRDYRSTVPSIPPDIRPKRGLQNYHILYEAEWTMEYPKDPMLLRRVGTADLWLVVAAWELTDIEREVLSAHQPVRQ